MSLWIRVERGTGGLHAIKRETALGLRTGQQFKVPKPEHHMRRMPQLPQGGTVLDTGTDQGLGRNLSFLF